MNSEKQEWFDRWITRLEDQKIELARKNTELEIKLQTLETEIERESVDTIDAAKQEALQDPKEAYNWAFQYGPCDETRQVACKEPQFAYYYAKTVDKQSRDDTRAASCKDACYAYCYAKYVDKSFHKETWQAVQGSNETFNYIGYVGVPEKFLQSTEEVTEVCSTEEQSLQDQLNDLTERFKVAENQIAELEQENARLDLLLKNTGANYIKLKKEHNKCIQESTRLR